MTENTVIGIDLGTTNSEVAIIRDGRPEIVREKGEAIMPSCVGVDDAGRVIVGSQARNQWAVAPERTVLSVKRLMGSTEKVSMGDKDYTPQEISAFILGELRDRASRSLGHQVNKAVITVPAYFTDVQRQATKEAGKLAGIEVVRIINEPTAAALSYNQHEDASTVLVYDLGGGTFDVSIVQIEDGVVEVLATTGNNRLGGDDFDQLILDELNTIVVNELGISDATDDRVLQARLRRAAEKAKIELSDVPFVTIDEDHVGQASGGIQHLSTVFGRPKFNVLIGDLLQSTIKKVNEALVDADMNQNQLNKILLVGGSTRIQRISELLVERLGREPHGEVDPDLCVALGAGVQAGIEMGLDMEAVLVDVTPYTFGTSAIGELYGNLYQHTFVPIIRRNSKLPATQTSPFQKLMEDQDSIRFRVYQGENPDALHNVEIGEVFFEGLDLSAEAYKEGITCKFHLDLDGLLHVEVVERATGRKTEGKIENALGIFLDDDVPSLQDLVISDTESDVESGGNELTETLDLAKKALEKATDDDREEILQLVSKIDAAVKDDRQDEIEILRANLEEILFYLG